MSRAWKESNDPEFWPKYRRRRRLYARRPKNGVRRCVDEFGPLNLQPRHGRHYARIRHVDRLRASYHRTGGVQHFLGLYDLERDTLTGRFVWRKNWRTFLEFLKWVRGQYPMRRWLHVVLDNVGYHRKAEVQAYAASHRIKFYWTPTNASWLNRIECQFTALQKFALDNTDHRTHQEQQQALRHYWSWRNRRRGITLQPWTPSRHTTSFAA